MNGGNRATRSVRHEAVKPCRMGATVNFYGTCRMAERERANSHNSSWCGRPFAARLPKKKRGGARARLAISFGLIQCHPFLLFFFFSFLPVVAVMFVVPLDVERIISIPVGARTTSWRLPSVMGITPSAAGH